MKHGDGCISEVSGDCDNFIHSRLILSESKVTAVKRDFMTEHTLLPQFAMPKMWVVVRAVTSFTEVIQGDATGSADCVDDIRKD